MDEQSEGLVHKIYGSSDYPWLNGLSDNPIAAFRNIDEAIGAMPSIATRRGECVSMSTMKGHDAKLPLPKRVFIDRGFVGEWAWYFCKP